MSNATPVSMTRLYSDEAAPSSIAQGKDHFVCDLQLDGDDTRSESKPSISLRVSLPERLLRDRGIPHDPVDVAAARGDLAKMHIGKSSVATLKWGSQAASFGQATTDPSNDVLESIGKVVKVVQAVSEVRAKLDAASMGSID